MRFDDFIGKQVNKLSSFRQMKYDHVNRHELEDKRSTIENTHKGNLDLFKNQYVFG